MFIKDGLGVATYDEPVLFTALLMLFDWFILLLYTQQFVSI